MTDAWTIDSDSPRHYLCAFYLDFELGNILGHVCRDPGGPWTIAMRHRVYVDGKTFDSADEKSFGTYTAGADMTDDQVRLEVNRMVKHFARFDGFGQLKRWRVMDVNGSGVELMKCLSICDFVHCKELEP